MKYITKYSTPETVNRKREGKKIGYITHVNTYIVFNKPMNTSKLHFSTCNMNAFKNSNVTMVEKHHYIMNVFSHNYSTYMLNIDH